MGADMGHPMGWQGFGYEAPSAFAEPQSQPAPVYTTSAGIQQCDYCDCYFEEEFDSTTDEGDDNPDRKTCLLQVIDLCNEVLKTEETGNLGS